MLDRLLLDHPRAIGESYGEHARTAAGFGVAMIAGGAACIVHAAIPALFTRTGSDTVKRLYARMMARQPAVRDRPAVLTRQNWPLEYEI